MKRGLMLSATLLLTGCGLLAPEGGAGASAGPSLSSRLFTRSNAEELVAYLDRLRGLSETALDAELARQRETMQRDSSDLARLKTALAASLARPGEEGDILALVEPVSRKASADPDLKAVASFLQALAADRRRLRESATAAGARLRDERRALEAQKQRADVQQQRADALQERAAQLQQKLDALTEIEKSLSDRQPPSR
jgi:hypothetical protein